jgi:hypothetical protein
MPTWKVSTQIAALQFSFIFLITIASIVNLTLCTRFTEMWLCLLSCCLGFVLRNIESTCAQ